MAAGGSVRSANPTPSSNASVSSLSSTDIDSTEHINNGQQFATSYWTQLQMLTHRFWTAKMRDTPDLRAQLIKNVLSGCTATAM